MKRLLALLLLAAAAAAQVPTPESVLGHKPGDDFYLASYSEALAYFQKLAQSTNKLKLVNVGKTSRGLDWYVAVISSPANLAKLDQYKDAARRLALVKSLTDAQARTLAHDSKVIVHIDGGLHATEVACAQHTIQLAYNLVTSNTPETAAILDNVILVLWFSINPDGQNQVVDWYRANLGTPYEVSNLPTLYQEYIGHDNNRDGYMNNMHESQVITKMDLDFYPTVFYNHHQTAPFPARIWIPPFGDPVSLNAHPLMYRWINVFGTEMAAYLDEHDMPGAMHRGRFDDWYPGFVDHVNNFRNTVSFLTETALYRYATPHFYTVEDFPRDKQDLRAEVFYASPWKGGWWRLGDAVRYMIGSSMAVLDTAAKNREELLYTRYQAGKDVIQKFTQNPPYAYVIPRDQRDRGEAAQLVDKMMTDGIEVHRASREFTAAGARYKEGDWVILMDQPFASLVKELFDLQKYPTLPGAAPAAGATAGGAGGRGAAAPAAGGAGRGAATPAATPATTAAPATGGRGGRGAAGAAAPGAAAPAALPQLPYDVTGWTLPIQMGVEVIPVSEPVSAEARSSLRKLDRPDAPAGIVEGAGPVFTFSHNTNGAIKAVNEILAAGGKVSFSKTTADIYASGAGAADALRRNTVDAASRADTPESFDVKKPRIALYDPWGGNIDEGWTRWVLDQYKFGFTIVRNSDIRNGHLNAHYDVVLIAEQSANQILNGPAAGSVPGQYAGGLGEEGAQALRDFATAGGTVITLGNASLFAIEQFNLAVANVLEGVPQTQFFCSGSLLRADLAEGANPLTAGLPPHPALMFERNAAFEPRTAFRGKVLVTYTLDRNPLLSGFLLGGDRIQGKAAALDATYGRGHVILLGFRPQWRGQSHSTYKFLFNAFYYTPSMAPAPAEQAEGGRGGRGGRGGGGGNPQQAAWRREAESIRTALSGLIDLNKAWFAARGPAAADAGKRLTDALDAFQRDRLPVLETLRAQVEDPAVARAEAQFQSQVHLFAVDLRTKDFSTSRLEDLMDQYKLAVLP